MMKQIVFLILVVSLCGCRAGRPEGEEARRQFEALYPDVEVVDLWVTEDEVIARSFRFRYRARGSDEESEVELQFMEAEDDGGWILRPAPPKSFP